MKRTSRSFHLTRQQEKLVDRLIVAFNSIDKHLRHLNHGGKTIPFPEVVAASIKRALVTPEDGEALRTLASLRNVLVHEKVSSHHAVIPTPPFVEEIEQLRSRIRNPLLVIPTFRRKVEVVSVSDSLSSVLRLVDTRDYSQFPAYDGHRFKGLLTEHGITRWLAHHVSNHLTIVELEEINVRAALREEENARLNVRFHSRDSTVNEVKRLFASHELLEAVLITETGSPKEELLGLATRWDILQLH
jgi:predicted transcriptional regulator